MKIRVNRYRMIFALLVLVLLYDSIAKFSNSSWTLNQFGTLASMESRPLFIPRVLEFALCVVAFLFLKGLRKDGITPCAVGLIVFGIIWWVQSGKGTNSFYYNMPPYWLIIFGTIFLIAPNEVIQDFVKKTCGILAAFYLVLCTVNVINFYITYSGTRMADGIAISYFSQAIFLTAIWSCLMEKKNRNTGILFGMCFVLVIDSIIITSRGWMLQAIFLMIYCYLLFSNRKLSYKVFRVLLLMLIGGILLYVLLTRFEDATYFILARFSEDTRSNQYNEFFSQVPFMKLMIGQGMEASYRFGTRGDYQFIDNQFLFLMFRYGLISMLCYVIPYFMAIVRTIKSNNMLSTKLKSMCPVIMWLMSMMGLSIYYGLYVDIAHVYMLVYVVMLIRGDQVIKNKEGE